LSHPAPPTHQRFRGGIVSEGKSGEGIRDDVDPEQLNGGENRLLLVGETEDTKATMTVVTFVEIWNWRNSQTAS